MKRNLKVIVLTFMMLLAIGPLFNIAKAVPKITTNVMNGSTVEGGTVLEMTVKDSNSKITSLKYAWAGESEITAIPGKQNPSNECVINLVVGTELGPCRLDVTAVNEKGEKAIEVFFYEISLGRRPPSLTGLDDNPAIIPERAYKIFTNYIEDDEVVEDPLNHYISFGKPLIGFQDGMSDEKLAEWSSIAALYGSGNIEWVEEANQFRKSGDFSSYIDEEGNPNGWLYASGVGSYVAVSKGEVMEKDLDPDTLFYTPNGNAYIVGEDGKLTLDGTVDWVRYGSYIGPKAGYHADGEYFWTNDENGKLTRYYYNTAPKTVLANEGYYRRGNNLIQLSPGDMAMYERWKAENADSQDLDETEIDLELMEDAQTTDNKDASASVETETSEQPETGTTVLETRRENVTRQIDRFLNNKGSNAETDTKTENMSLAKNDKLTEAKRTKQAEKRAVQAGATASVGRNLIGQVERCLAYL